LGVGINPGMAFTPFPSSIGQDWNPQPSNCESSMLTSRPDFLFSQIKNNVFKTRDVFRSTFLRSATGFDMPFRPTSNIDFKVNKKAPGHELLILSLTKMYLSISVNIADLVSISSTFYTCLFVQKSFRQLFYA